jgi:hypothetical protein
MVKKFSFLISEAFNIDNIAKKFNDEYSELKKDILIKSNETLEEDNVSDITKKQLFDFLSEYISVGKDANMINGLLEDNDIFNFYLKHQMGVDKFLNDSGYMEKTPIENNVYTLYEIIIDGVKETILEMIKIIQKEIK